MFPYCCLLIICINVVSMFSFQGTSELVRSRKSSSRTSFNEQEGLAIYFISLGCCLGLVGQSGLEPPTSRLSVVCSSQLSYWPVWWR